MWGRTCHTSSNILDIGVVYKKRALTCYDAHQYSVYLDDIICSMMRVICRELPVCMDMRRTMYTQICVVVVFLECCFGNESTRFDAF